MTSRVPKIPLVTFLTETEINNGVIEMFPPRRRNRSQERSEVFNREVFLAEQRAAVKEEALRRGDVAIDRYRAQGSLDTVSTKDRLFALKALAVESHRYHRNLCNKTHPMSKTSYCTDVVQDIDYIMRKPMRNPLGRNAPPPSTSTSAPSSPRQTPRGRDRYKYVKLELAGINMWRSARP